MMQKSKAFSVQMITVCCDDLAQMTNLSVNTIRTYLEGYRFIKYENLSFKKKYRRLGYMLTEEFIKEFIDYLYLRNKIKEVEIFKKNLRKELKNENLQG